MTRRERELSRPTCHARQGFALIMALSLASAGCAPGSQAEKQAGQGAALGAVGGAVAGAVGSLLWGGNVVEGAVKGGMVGAASGAAMGAVSGSAADNAAKQQPGAAAPAGAEAKEAELRKRIGDRNYATTVLLTQCRHRDAIASAQATLGASTQADERAYALFIQSVAAEEVGDKALANALYPKIVQESPERGSVDKVRADVLEGLMKVQATRRQHGLPALCERQS
jgi:hypothetical protein